MLEMSLNGQMWTKSVTLSRPTNAWGNLIVCNLEKCSIFLSGIVDYQN